MYRLDFAAGIRTLDGQLRCYECITQTHTQCPGCYHWYPRNGSCDDCLTCCGCNEPTPSDDLTTTIDSDDVCWTCLERSYWQCLGCFAWNSDNDSRCRNGCDNRSDLILIYDHDYKPEPEFHGKGPLHLGVELEIHTPHDTGNCAEIAMDHLGSLGYLKNDASVSDGFEIVTHPMSYTWALDNFPWDMLAKLEDAGCSTSEDTGLHVHVSRAGFDSPCHVFRWMKFIYRNRSQVIRLARRSSAHWADFTDADRHAVKHYAKGAHGERYRAINTGNDDTFEIRVFASSLDMGDVQAALALAVASIEYTRQLSVPRIFTGGWQWPAFAAWVDTRIAYAPLHRQMQAMACAC
ncbi:hypothetical protein Aca07nite_84590 [Actinoplanes capillaceus]|uniref:Amidoligase enzyme n=1 Tax=Actinoplanes campanulatus TaxID=113559 RepID=A0ABQ3WY20_9ACTN|nr:hypothetical protein [Actinoplanes capillaceus]GID51184.1 hypothetical protein Aca07nite_84590 [Actinoplanes capillaceus]